MTRRVGKPPWLRVRMPATLPDSPVLERIRNRALCTVCVEAHCPNQMHCFQRGTAAFMLLGPACTRRCTFCAVEKGPVRAPDPAEPERIAQAVEEMGLSYSVLTMVTRDDLPDGGAAHVARTVEAIRKRLPDLSVEVLISDLGGNRDALRRILDAGVDVLNHNVETVARLYSKVRPQADYRRSLELLERAAGHNPRVVTKSGLMVGLGEELTEVVALMQDLRNVGCRLVTAGQYLSPSEHHHPVVRYVTPEAFQELERQALAMGFSGAACAPLVRSSYEAQALFQTARL
ncbi:lipoyl synthase [Desulfoglaeba alkanexedens]|uniref:Lipoyl synthase n=1 Tax=Desulfoglaeba alkanexedens ALDC TaxID=980445 RepID=A0A4P8KZC4_9BACT|nr:lipoyl synthase [Desulfoglaeba alkanexedens]QCQ20897.1 lipoyl synthase [Desulfoglaeba alkanexedens ALDC]